MDNEKGKKNNGFLSDDRKPTLLLKKEILSFIDHYRTNLYPKYYGHEHPYLKLSQLRYVHNQLYCFAYDVGWLDDDDGLLVECFSELAESFFERVNSNDHNINHFVSGDMLEVRYYDSGFYG